MTTELETRQTLEKFIIQRTMDIKKQLREYNLVVLYNNVPGFTDCVNLNIFKAYNEFINRYFDNSLVDHGFCNKELENILIK